MGSIGASLFLVPYLRSGGVGADRAVDADLFQARFRDQVPDKGGRTEPLCTVVAVPEVENSSGCFRKAGLRWREFDVEISLGAVPN